MLFGSRVPVHTWMKEAPICGQASARTRNRRNPVRARFESPRCERGGEQDADGRRVGLRGLHLATAANVLCRDGPGEIEEITTATASLAGGYDLEPVHRNFHSRLRVVFSIHPDSFGKAASLASTPSARDTGWYAATG